MSSQQPKREPFDRRRMMAWLRDSAEGRNLVARAASRYCARCPRLRQALDRCKGCQHRQHAVEILDRIPPNSPEAEAALIGSVLLDPERHRRLIVETQPADFYGFQNELIWKAMWTLAVGGKPIDVTLLAERMKRDGTWDAAGGAAYLAETSHSVAVAAHAEHYATVVREKAVLRRTIHAACELLRACYDVGASLDADGDVRKAVEKLKGILRG